MNIQEIKTKLGVQTLPLQIVTTQTGEPTSWFKKWDNDTRIAILIHADTLGLTAPQTKMSKASGQEYTVIYICNYKEADVTL